MERRGDRLVALRNLRNAASVSTRELAPRLQDPERARRRRHEEAITAGDQSLDIFSIGMRMAAGNVMLLTNSQNIVDRFRDDGVVIVARMAQFLAQISFADEDHSDTRHLFQNSR